MTLIFCYTTLLPWAVITIIMIIVHLTTLLKIGLEF